MIRTSLLVIRCTPGATVQDGGRQGQLHRGLPPSGPLDPSCYRRANRAVGNVGNEAVLEIPLGPLTIQGFHRPALLSVDGDAPIVLRPEETLQVQPNGRAVRYLAVRGGLDVPPVAGSRATLPVARLGGYKGRFLRKGDVITVGQEPSRLARSVVFADHWSLPSLRPAPTEPAAHADAQPIFLALPELQVFPGPQRDRFPAAAWQAFLGAEWRVSGLSDRTGTRLEGPQVPSLTTGRELSAPMIRGAIQIVQAGSPIVLGPDHPCTGGYPVLAVLRREDQGTLAQLRPGSRVRFAVAPTWSLPQGGR